jgi:hypothetical protein
MSAVFRRGKLWHSGRISGDEGFSVDIGGRDAIAYYEGSRKMTITVDEGNSILYETIGRWDDDPMHRLSDQDRARIADNIKRRSNRKAWPYFSQIPRRQPSHFECNRDLCAPG